MLLVRRKLRAGSNLPHRDPGFAQKLHDVGLSAVAAVYRPPTIQQVARPPAVIDVIDRRFSRHALLFVQSRSEPFHEASIS